MRQMGFRNTCPTSGSVNYRQRRPSKFAAAALIALMAISSGNTESQESRVLRISATILPRPCDVTESCNLSVPNRYTRVTVMNGAVTYVGTRPFIIRKSGLLIILL